MKDLKKLVIIGPAWPLRGGTSLFNVRLCQALVRKGVETAVVSFSRQYPASLFPGQSQYTPEPKPEIGMPMIDTCNPLSWVKTCRWIRDYRPDAVVFTWWHSWFWPCYKFMATRLSRSGLPVFFLCHNYTTHDQSHRGKWFAADLSKQATGLVFLSRLTQRQHQARQPLSATLFHPYYEWEEWPVKPQVQWSGKIFWGGCIKPYKGVETCLEILALDDRLRITMAGDAYDRRLLRQIQSVAPGFGSRLQVKTGFHTDENLVRLLDDHDLLLCSHRSATQSGMAALALGRRRPVVATPVGGLPGQICRETGVVAAQAAPGSLIEAIYKVYEKSPGQWAQGIEAHRPECSFSHFAALFKEAVMKMITSSNRTSRIQPFSANGQKAGLQ